MKYRIIQKGKTNPKYKIQKYGMNFFKEKSWFNLVKEVEGVWFRRIAIEKWKNTQSDVIWFNTEEEAQSKLEELINQDEEEAEVTVKEVGEKKSKISKS
jgi:hypothetical protein